MSELTTELTIEETIEETIENAITLSTELELRIIHFQNDMIDENALLACLDNNLEDAVELNFDHE